MTDPDKKLTLEELEAELNALKVTPDAEPQLPSAPPPPPEVPAGPLPLVPGESA